MSTQAAVDSLARRVMFLEKDRARLAERVKKLEERLEPRSAAPAERTKMSQRATPGTIKRGKGYHDGVAAPGRRCLPVVAVPGVVIRGRRDRADNRLRDDLADRQTGRGI